MGLFSCGLLSRSLPVSLGLLTSLRQQSFAFAIVNCGDRFGLVGLWWRGWWGRVILLGLLLLLVAGGGWSGQYSFHQRGKCYDCCALGCDDVPEAVDNFLCLFKALA